MITRVCKWCNIEKSSEDFYAKGGNKCKACRKLSDIEYRKINRNRLKEKQRSKYAVDPDKYREYARKYREKNKDKLKASQRGKWLRLKYKISEEQYNVLFRSQQGVCAICEREPENENLSVDHCHITGEVRGLLCSRCNVAIGILGDTSIGVRKALEYLESWEKSI